MGLTGRKGNSKVWKGSRYFHYPPRDTVSALDQIKAMTGKSPGFRALHGELFSFFLLVATLVSGGDTGEGSQQPDP